MKIKRRRTRKIWVGNVPIGGDAPISLQSMVKIPIFNIKKAVSQIRELEEAGCQIVRVAVPDLKSAQAISAIKKEVKIPLVADIHFNYRLAMAAMEQRVDKIRLNPGNICHPEEVGMVVREAKRREIPIRIGVNSGSVNTVVRLGDPRVNDWQIALAEPTSANLAGGSSHPAPASACRRQAQGAGKLFVVRKKLSQKMVDAALNYVQLFEKLKFNDIVISLKTPDIQSTIESYRLMAKKVDYPFHLGMTATGPMVPALIKSSLGIGILLMEGVGDTIRVSLTESPVEEVKAGYEILRGLGLRRGIEIISCPTCGRCRVNLIKIVKDVEEFFNSELRTHNSELSLKVAIMGCEVNGPGEARDADVGIAFGGNSALLFKKGKPVRKVKERNVVQVLLNEVRGILK